MAPGGGLVDEADSLMNPMAVPLPPPPMNTVPLMEYNRPVALVVVVKLPVDMISLPDRLLLEAPIRTLTVMVWPEGKPSKPMASNVYMLPLGTMSFAGIANQPMITSLVNEDCWTGVTTESATDGSLPAGVAVSIAAWTRPTTLAAGFERLIRGQCYVRQRPGHLVAG